MTSHTSRLLTLAVLFASPSIALAQPAPAGMVTTLSLADTVNGGHTVRRGDSGSAVRELQAHLVRHGHVVGTDGDFGPGTEAAVQAFQRAKGLTADGLVGPTTLRNLEQPAAAPSGGGGGGIVGALGGAPSSTRPPSSSTAPADAYAVAMPWARAANAAGRHTLVIVFEGQFAYASGYARRIYDHQDALRAGQSPSRPVHTGLSFVSTQLIVPNLPESQRTADLLILPETSENGSTSIAEQSARAWHQVHGASLKVIVIGHSLGGWSAIQCGNKLARHNIPVASMLTVDARTYTQNYPFFIKPRSVVGAHKNYFQKSPIFPGYAIQGAENVHLHVNHAQIPGAPEVVASYRAMLR